MSASKSIAGIQELDDARVIPMTRRPDGTYRKERKVRPGYTPPEDVAKYSNRVLDSVRPAPAPVAVPVNNTPKTKTQIKNDKRKAKRKEEGAVEPTTNPAEGPETTAEIANSTNTTNTTPTATASAESSITTTAAAAVDPEKKLRALNKKLRQAELLKERRDKGEELLPEQAEKVSKMDELLAQIAELSL
ncbi:putative RNA binding protein Pym [Dissophora ornata]|nr:hypothetical protein BGZ58_008828 [Dissophora ornata]KAI8594869.1 putative RNA binding protein Pym [Dissophora ornata]